MEMRTITGSRCRGGVDSRRIIKKCGWGYLANGGMEEFKIQRVEAEETVEESSRYIVIRKRVTHENVHR